jgi:hypothetical protein
MANKPKAKWFLLVRTYERSPMVSVWLIRDGNTGRGALLWGEVPPEAVEEIAEATGLPVAKEEGKIGNVKPLTVPGCMPLEQQQSLFQ